MSHYIARVICLGVIATSSPGLMATALAQPCAHRWDVEFGASGPRYAIIWDLEVYDDGGGPALYAAGQFSEFQGQRAWGIAKWNGHEWSEVGGGLSRDGEWAPGLGLRVWDDGRGPALYVGGGFDHAGEVPANNIARWDGEQWEALGDGVDGGVSELCAFDDGRGMALYVGGSFTSAGGQPARRIARWSGSDWEPLGGGLNGGWLRLGAMTVFDDGGGPQLYVGGDFTSADGIPAMYLARWNGQEWSALEGVNLSRTMRHYEPMLEELLVFDDGSGPALFMAGNFHQVGVGECFLKWDGRTVTAPQGLVLDYIDYPETMFIDDDASGPALWLAGGVFSIGERINRTTIARWDGETWFKPDSYPSTWVAALASFNDGYGNGQYVGGYLNRMSPGGEPIQSIVRWSAPHMALSHSPLRAGQRAVFATTCSTPGQRVNFIYSARGLGSLFIPQLGISIDLDRPQLIGHSIADPGGKAGLSRAIPSGTSGRTLWLQAAEVGRKTEVVESVIE